MPVLNIDKLDFDKEVLHSDGAVAIKFITFWDSICRSFSETFEECAKEYEGKIRFFESNIDGNPDLAEQLGISKVPTVVLFLNGKELKRLINPSKPFFKAELESLAKKARRI